MKIFIQTILILFCSLTALADSRLAIINDPDGFTNVRSGPGKDFLTIDTLFKNDFFYFELTDNSDWAKVTAWKGRQIEGFIHKSRIQEFEKLDKTKQKVYIVEVLGRQEELATNFQKAWKSKDSIAYRKAGRELESHNDIRYDPILSVLAIYFCATADLETLKLFISTMWADKGSANEMPSFAIGDCYICKPDIVIEQTAKLKDKEQRELVFDHIEWGLLNHFGVEEDGKSTDETFNKLKLRLDKERKKASP
jgi:hypothetical protein